MEPISAAAVCYGIGKAFAAMASAGIRYGKDWYVDSSIVSAIEMVYQKTHDKDGKKIDHRRRPWCTMRRVISAYKTGKKEKFEELKKALEELNEEMQEEDVKKEVEEALGGGTEGNQAVASMSEAVASMCDAVSMA